jgi:hypothetical protein
MQTKIDYSYTSASRHGALSAGTNATLFSIARPGDKAVTDADGKLAEPSNPNPVSTTSFEETG